MLTCWFIWRLAAEPEFEALSPFKQGRISELRRIFENTDNAQPPQTRAPTVAQLQVKMHQTLKSDEPFPFPKVINHTPGRWERLRRRQSLSRKTSTAVIEFDCCGEHSWRPTNERKSNFRGKRFQLPTLSLLVSFVVEFETDHSKSRRTRKKSSENPQQQSAWKYPK